MSAIDEPDTPRGFPQDTPWPAGSTAGSCGLAPGGCAGTRGGKQGRTRASTARCRRRAGFLAHYGQQMKLGILRLSQEPSSDWYYRKYTVAKRDASSLRDAAVSRGLFACTLNHVSTGISRGKLSGGKPREPDTEAVWIFGRVSEEQTRTAVADIPLIAQLPGDPPHQDPFEAPLERDFVLFWLDLGATPLVSSSCQGGRWPI